MADEDASVTDPLGKKVYLLPNVILDKNDKEGIYDDAATIIAKPAILIETKEDNKTEFYYFRSVGWNNTMLIKVGFSNKRWEAYKYIKNPSTEALTELLRRGKQII